ncbi:MAG: DUF47 family protein [Byssovorax sp.]
MWLDRAVQWLLPREEHFFDLLERGSASAKKSSAILLECCDAKTAADRMSAIERMTEEEHAADRVIHEVYEALNKTFVTPLDRTDIYSLATDLENITDLVNRTMMQITLHALDDLPPGSRELAVKIGEACAEIDAGVKLLRGMKQLDEIRRHCKAIGKIEHDGDQIFRKTVAEMFKSEKDAIKLLKNKEFLEALEMTIDACDDVSNALEALVIKNA